MASITEVLTVSFWKGVWDDATDYIDDRPIQWLKSALEAIAKHIQAVAPPDFLSQYSLSNVMSPAMADIGYFLSNSGISTALTIIAAAYVFRATRKIVTFGLW